jgi:ribulose 1,5-bisphosphate synthetase/thiazole synthase
MPICARSFPGHSFSSPVRRWLSLLMVVCAPFQSPSAYGSDLIETDVCVYGGTASGVAAALAAARSGRQVVIVEPFRHLGGMHGGGIRIQQDCLYRDHIGGIARELHDADYALPGGGSANQWQARLMIRQKVEQAGIRFFTEHRLDSREDVVMEGSSIRRIHLNHAPIQDEGVPAAEPKQRSALSIQAKVFIDASYEGDLMAFAGCDYTVGREAKATHGESLAGQGHLRHFDVDPYQVPGDPDSGVLPMISTEPYEPGAASRYILTYNFRLKGMRDGPAADTPGTVLKPLGRDIDLQQYELVRRGLESPQQGVIGWFHWNYNRKSMVSTGPPGRQADYPDGDWATRAAIWRDWIDHVKTMNELCGIHNPVLPAGEYPDNGDFPDQLYIRMSRRLKGEYTITQHDLMHQTIVNDSIGLAYYAVDIYPPRLIAHEGKVASEGEVFVRVSPGPYPLSYRALLPKKAQCTNLIVSVCLSASHVAMASIRMESSYVVLGEAAGIAASQAVSLNKSLQELDVAVVRSTLHEAGVITDWDGRGYGPNSPRHWPATALHWIDHPEDYQKIPIGLDPGWQGYDPAKDSGFAVTTFPSREAWNQAKPGFEWLFPHIDTDGDGSISLEEHEAFQEYKKLNKNWSKTLKAK